MTLMPLTSSAWPRDVLVGADDVVEVDVADGGLRVRVEGALHRVLEVVGGDAAGAVVEEDVGAQVEGVDGAVAADVPSSSAMSGMMFRSLSKETRPEKISTMYSAEPASEAQAGSRVIGSPPKRRSSPWTRSGSGAPVSSGSLPSASLPLPPPPTVSDDEDADDNDERHGDAGEYVDEPAGFHCGSQSRALWCSV